MATWSRMTFLLLVTKLLLLPISTPFIQLVDVVDYMHLIDYILEILQNIIMKLHLGHIDYTVKLHNIDTLMTREEIGAKT